jgi:predicted aspartyl protease
VITKFDPDLGLIVIDAQIEGPTGSLLLRLALDTGATQTLIRSGALVAIGYDPANSSDWVEVATASAVARLPVVTLQAIRCLGQVRKEFAVLSHDLPPDTAIAGLLGLDFLRAGTLTINFPKAEIKLTRLRSRKSGHV